MTVKLRAPFPWFGGKSRVADQVWSRFGDVPNFVEPFAGSLAVLLSRPTPSRIETVNDLDCYVSNFWRAVRSDPETVAYYADWPVNEADLHARHRWLVGRAEFREQMRDDPEFFDAKIAGWWVWGICQWIGSGWCSSPEWTGRTNAGAFSSRHPDGLGRLRGPTSVPRVSASTSASEVSRARRRGRNGPQQLPSLGGSRGAAGSGVHASGLTQKMPRMDRGTDSRLAATSDAIVGWMRALQDRLRNVRVTCGDWKRILGRSVTECIGVTGVFLDPPYGDGDRDPSLYAHDDVNVAAAVREWAIDAGENPKMRIALCGYEGEHDMPRTWDCVAWKAGGGYAAAAGNHANAHRERIWFSPHCIEERRLFDWRRSEEVPA